MINDFKLRLRTTGLRAATLAGTALMASMALGGAAAAASPTPPPTPTSTFTSSVCPVPFVPPPTVTLITTRTVTVHYNGIDIPQCGFPAGVPTLYVYYAGTDRLVESDTAQAGVITGDLIAGQLTAGTGYDWKLTSTGRGIPSGSGTFTTPATDPTASPSVSPSVSPTGPFTPCPVPLPPLPALTAVTDTTATVHFQGLQIPQCRFSFTPPTLVVWRADAPAGAPPVASVTDTTGAASGDLTATGLQPSTAYRWQVDSTGNGLRAGSGTFTTAGATPSASSSQTPSASQTPSSSLTPSQTPSVTPSLTPSQSCTAAARSTRVPGGYLVDVTVTAGPQAITGWTVTWPAARLKVASGWNASFSLAGGVYSARNLSWNGPLKAGRRTHFGVLTFSRTDPDWVALTCIPT